MTASCRCEHLLEPGNLGEVEDAWVGPGFEFADSQLDLTAGSGAEDERTKVIYIACSHDEHPSHVRCG